MLHGIIKSAESSLNTFYTYYGNDLVKEMYDYKVSGTSLRLYHYVYNTYDGLNRLTSQAEVSGSSVPSDLSPYTVTYTYDLKDRLSAVSYGSASGSEVDGMIYHYSGTMLTDVSVKIGSNTYLAKAYTYNKDGSVQTVKDYYNFRNGDTANYLLLSYSYDAFGRVTDLQYSKAGEKVEQHSYAYDKNSNIIRESNFNTFSELDEIRSYTYDNLNQLTDSVFKNIITETVTVEGEADEDGNPTTTTQTVTREEEALTTSYAYDIVGNRIQKVENGAATNYTYNSLNQLMSEKGTGTNLTYRYDENGNQTGITGTSGGSNVNKTFTYTPEDMLETYTEGSASQINLYNGEGQRVQKKEGNDVTNYYYQFGNVLYTTDVNGSLKSFNLLNRIDTFGTARKSETAEDYYLYTDDLRGSTVNILDSSANKVASYWYNDFGEVTESKASSYSSFNNELQYTGAVYDDSTGLLYLNARFYDPQTGRFISRDTYRGEQDDAGTWHLYAYCANNPVNYVDPSGHFYVAIPFIGGILIASCIIYYGYIKGSISIGNNSNSFKFKLNRKKQDRYEVRIQFHGPDRYNHKSGISAMKARWKDMKGTRTKKVKTFLKKHNYRYHAHIRITKNGKHYKTINL